MLLRYLVKYKTRLPRAPVWSDLSIASDLGMPAAYPDVTAADGTHCYLP